MAATGRSETGSLKTSSLRLALQELAHPCERHQDQRDDRNARRHQLDRAQYEGSFHGPQGLRLVGHGNRYHLRDKHVLGGKRQRKMAENSRKSFQAGFIEFIELSRVIGCGISMTWRDCLAFDVDQIRAQLLRLRILW